MQTLPMQKFVDISDGNNGLTVVNNCLIEYEAMDNWFDWRASKRDRPSWLDSFPSTMLLKTEGRSNLQQNLRVRRNILESNRL